MIKFAWIVIIYNGVSDHIQTNIIRRLTGQLYLDGKDVAQAKKSALSEIQFIKDISFSNHKLIRNEKQIRNKSPWINGKDLEIEKLNKIYKRLGNIQNILVVCLLILLIFLIIFFKNLVDVWSDINRYLE